MKKNVSPVKTLYVREYDKHNLSEYPSFSVTGNISVMRKIYGDSALLVRCGQYIYNVAAQPKIYICHAH